eukprot:TRINITY_DN2630_c8_g1_i1.p1 TRINITY_DN2630_c8_g1~~TRINITY_DN2630_c8_g1_i1.p1  ORF type:complete len:172 (+),score=23.98 TRINITY_DN2630_c8_g1_i1:89-604(+)
MQGLRPADSGAANVAPTDIEPPRKRARKCSPGPSPDSVSPDRAGRECSPSFARCSPSPSRASPAPTPQRFLNVPTLPSTRSKAPSVPEQVRSAREEEGERLVSKGRDRSMSPPQAERQANSRSHAPSRGGSLVDCRGDVEFPGVRTRSHAQPRTEEDETANRRREMGVLLR